MPKATLLLVHGLIGTLDCFDPATRIARASVRTCNLPGYGTLQNAAAEELSLTRHADHVVALIRAMECGPVWLLGHSMGGAVVMLAADRAPELVAGIISVEGNFTLKDAFWSGQIISKTADEWAAEYRAMRDDVAGWLTRCGIEPTHQRNTWAAAILANQPASTVYAMSKAIVAETCGAEFLASVRRVIDRGLPIHLIAGRKSAAAWDVPDFVRAAAVSSAEQPETGHLMMLEDPDTFCRIVEACLPRP